MDLFTYEAFFQMFAFNGRDCEALRQGLPGDGTGRQEPASL